VVTQVHGDRFFSGGPVGTVNRYSGNKSHSQDLDVHYRRKENCKKKIRISICYFLSQIACSLCLSRKKVWLQYLHLQYFCIAQAARLRLLTVEPWFNHGRLHVRLIMDKWQWSRFFPPNIFCFPLLLKIPHHFIRIYHCPWGVQQSWNGSILSYPWSSSWLHFWPGSKMLVTINSIFSRIVQSVQCILFSETARSCLHVHPVLSPLFLPAVFLSPLHPFLPAGWTVLLWSGINNLVFELIAALVVSKSLGQSGGDLVDKGPQGESYLF
jgi:hypothetical protein